MRTVVLLLSLLTSASTHSADGKATQILQKMDKMMRGETMQGRYRMEIVHPGWQRTMKFEFYSVGLEKSFIKMLAPAKNRGVKFLKINTEMWNYIPKVNRVIKIPPSMMLQSWMGSDFTNDDLVKESSVVEDYTHLLLPDEKMAGVTAHKIELTAKPDAPVVWDKIMYWVRTEDLLPLRADHFNQKGERIRQVIFSDIQQFGDRKLPAKMEMLLDKKPGNRTTLVLEKGKFNAKIPKGIFTQQNLRSRR